MTVALWQVLLKLGPDQPDADLNCDECFTLLNYVAEQLAGGADVMDYSRAIRQHLEHCLDCQEHHLQRLSDLEARLDVIYE